MEEIKKGDKVYKDVNKKYIVKQEDIGKVFTVKSNPIEISGYPYVLLENCRDWYPVEGLTKVQTKQ